MVKHHLVDHRTDLKKRNGKGDGGGDGKMEKYVIIEFYYNLIIIKFIMIKKH